MIVNGMLVTKELIAPAYIACHPPKIKEREKELSPSLQRIVNGLNCPKLKKDGDKKPLKSLRAIKEMEEQKVVDDKKKAEEKKLAR